MRRSGLAYPCLHGQRRPSHRCMRHNGGHRHRMPCWRRKDFRWAVIAVAVTLFGKPDKQSGSADRVSLLSTLSHASQSRRVVEKKRLSAWSRFGSWLHGLKPRLLPGTTRAAKGRPIGLRQALDSCGQGPTAAAQRPREVALDPASAQNWRGVSHPSRAGLRAGATK